ncbi:hypothetical protein IAU60_005093 [Kwoniella sp. DSM 27419]
MPKLYAIRIPDEPVPEETLNKLGSLIDEAGRERIKRFRLAEDALRSLVARLTVTWWLYAHGLLPEKTLPTFGRKGKGKPTLATPPLAPPLEFNNTHEGRYILFTTLRSTSPLACIGVDIMLPPFADAKDVQDGISYQLTLKEKLGLSADMSNEERAWRLTLLWSLKEGFTKAIGEGITFGMERIEVDLEPATGGGAERGDIPVRGVMVDGKDVRERGWEYAVGRIDAHGYAVWWRGDESDAGEAGRGGLHVETLDWDNFAEPLLRLADGRAAEDSG